jgi:hypothetical protein
MRFVPEPAGEETFRSCDHEIPLGSLPRIFRRKAADFSRQPQALLKADPARVEEMRGKLPPGPRIAISWRSFRYQVGESKSFPLEHFGVFEGTGARLIDLQYGEVSGEREAFDARHPGLRRQVPDLDLFNDFEGILAALESCDLLISNSVVTAHLGGIIGRPTWLMYLENVPPLYYWIPNGKGRSYWYPSVEIVTDRSWKTWNQVFDAVLERWKARAASTPRPS